MRAKTSKYAIAYIYNKYAVAYIDNKYSIAYFVLSYAVAYLILGQNNEHHPARATEQFNQRTS